MSVIETAFIAAGAVKAMRVGSAGAKTSSAGTKSTKALPQGKTSTGKSPGKTVDSRTGEQAQRFINDGKGNTMIEPKGGNTVPGGKNGVDTHTTYSNGSNYQRLNPNGHNSKYPSSRDPHGHGHLEGTGPGRTKQGPSLDVNGNVVPSNSPEAHWPLN